MSIDPENSLSPRPFRPAHEQAHERAPSLPGALPSGLALGFRCRLTWPPGRPGDTEIVRVMGVANGRVHVIRHVVDGHIDPDGPDPLDDSRDFWVRPEYLTASKRSPGITEDAEKNNNKPFLKGGL